MSEQQKSDPKYPDRQALNEVIDKSSSINRTLGLGFSAFIFIVALMVAATTDMDLFIPDSTFNFPLINLPLNIKYFYIAAPFVVLIMHYNLLYNLHQHSEKLLRLYPNNIGSQSNTVEEKPEKEHEPTLMYPFLFNFALTVQNPLHSFALNLVIRITVFMLPLALLFFILIRFADYQSMTISSWHFAAVLLDMALIATHSRSIIKMIKTRSDEVSDTYGWRDFFSFRRGKPRVIVFSVNAFKFAIHIIPAALSVVAASIIYVAGNVWSLLTRLKFRKRIFFTKTLDYLALAYKFLRLELIIAWLAVAYFFFFVYIMNVNINSYTAHRSLINPIIPRLSLPEEVLVKSQPIEHLKTLYLNTTLTPEERNQKEQEIMLKFSVPYILKGRSFRYSDLDQTVLTKSDLRGVDFTGAHLVSSIMQEVILTNVNLQDATLWIANLQGADLYQVKLQGVSLTQANLKGADLRKLELQGASLHGVNFQGAGLYWNNLKGAGLWNANLQGAYLQDANLQGAYLKDANLQGAYLKEANLQGADLREANLQGMIFEDIRIKGTLFPFLSVDTVLLISEPDETNDIFISDAEIDAIASLIHNDSDKSAFIIGMSEARYRFENVTLTLTEKIPNAKIYRPEDLEYDSAFFFIRRRIASQNKYIAQRMLEGFAPYNFINFRHSLYTDLYQFLKSNHPDYLEGFWYDEHGMEISTEK